MDARLLDVLQLARAGARDTALQRLHAYLKAHPGDANAWTILGGLAPDTGIALSALRRAVALDPAHGVARRRIAALESQMRSQASGSDLPDEDVPESNDLTLPATVPPTNVGTSPAAAPEILEESNAFQAVREARMLIWPFLPRGKQRRPLGELLDERQITRQDLVWASAEARSDAVRSASDVILESARHLPDVSMSLEDARLIAWPFRHLNRPLGELVDAGTVRVKDLRRAAWFARDARLREAARLLLPTALARREAHKRKRAKQQLAASPETGKTTHGGGIGATKVHAARPMPVIQGSNYLADEVQRRYRRQAAIAATATVLLAVLLGLAVVGVTRGLLKQHMPSIWIFPVMAALLLALLWLGERFTELHHEGLNFRRGQLGEAHVAQQLRHGLGGDWTLFRNVQLPGTHFDIDMVLLGPPGIFALEVKAYTGNYRYHKQDFYRRTAVGWRKLQHSPGKQARASSGLLHAYIADTLNRKLWVEPRLVWVGPGSLQLRNPEVYVWYFDQLAQDTERLRGQPARLSAEDQAALSGLLRGLCSTLRG